MNNFMTGFRDWLLCIVLLVICVYSLWPDAAGRVIARSVKGYQAEMSK